jgi:hypothetical protein
MRSATATNAIDHAVERRVLLIDWIVRIHQVSLRWHLTGARLAMSNRKSSAVARGHLTSVTLSLGLSPFMKFTLE